MTSYDSVKYVIFDLDGTLLDTEMINAQCFEKVLARYGAKFNNEIRFKIMGRIDRDVYPIFIEEYKLEVSSEDLAADVQEELSKRMSDVALMPGVEKLVTHLYENNVPMAIATSSPAEAIQAKTKNLGHVFDLFDHITSGSSDPEVKRGKPAPDIFLVCASRFPAGPQPYECLVFEDAPNGVKAATDAGMQVVMVPDPIIPVTMTKLATKVIPSLLAFKPEEFGLPGYHSSCPVLE